jgi:hypothetical protein
MGEEDGRRPQRRRAGRERAAPCGRAGAPSARASARSGAAAAPASPAAAAAIPAVKPGARGAAPAASKGASSSSSSSVTQAIRAAAAANPIKGKGSGSGSGGGQGTGFQPPPWAPKPTGHETETEDAGIAQAGQGTGDNGQPIAPGTPGEDLTDGLPTVAPGQGDDNGELGQGHGTADDDGQGQAGILPGENDTKPGSLGSQFGLAAPKQAGDDSGGDDGGGDDGSLLDKGIAAVKGVLGSDDDSSNAGDNSDDGGDKSDDDSTLDTGGPDIDPSAPLNGIMLAAVQNGTYDPPGWRWVPFPDWGIDILVMTDALKCPLGSTPSVRVPITWADARKACAALGAILPTAAMVDAIYQAADFHPHATTAITATAAGVARMATAGAVLQYHQQLEQQLAAWRAQQQDQGPTIATSGPSNLILAATAGSGGGTTAPSAYFSQGNPPGTGPLTVTENAGLMANDIYAFAPGGNPAMGSTPAGVALQAARGPLVDQTIAGVVGQARYQALLSGGWTFYEPTDGTGPSGTSALTTGGPDDPLLEPVGKWWIFDEAAMLRNVARYGSDVTAEYGYFDDNGNPIQPVSGAHNAWHIDYSMMFRAVSAWARKQGAQSADVYLPDLMCQQMPGIAQYIRMFEPPSQPPS